MVTEHVSTLLWIQKEILSHFSSFCCDLVLICCYRPQRSWGKVIFSQASVILLMGCVCSRGWCGADTPLEQTHPLEQTSPTRADTPRADTPRADTPRSRHPCEQTPPWSRHPQEQTPPWEQTPPGAGTPLGISTPWE